MATPGERKALIFLSCTLLGGVGVRAARELRGNPLPDSGARGALDAQIAAVDSARARGAPRPGPRPVGTARSMDAPRPDTIERRSFRTGRGGRPTAVGPSLHSVIDVDVATADEIEALPRVGPALARRIVADRDSNGPFGSLQALGRVSGIGPAMLKTLEARVKFSGTPRQATGVGKKRRPK